MLSDRENKEKKEKKKQVRVSYKSWWGKRSCPRGFLQPTAPRRVSVHGLDLELFCSITIRFNLAAKGDESPTMNQRTSPLLPNCLIPIHSLQQRN